MHPFDAVIKRSPIAKAAIVTATALVLTLTPSLSALAGPSHMAAVSRTAAQQDDSDQVIVPVGSPQDDPANVSEDDTAPVNSANDDDVAADPGDSDTAPAEDASTDSQDEPTPADDRVEVLQSPDVILPEFDLL